MVNLPILARASHARVLGFVVFVVAITGSPPRTAGAETPGGGGGTDIVGSGGDVLGGRFDRGRWMNESSNHYLNQFERRTEPAVFFLPPVPPPLGREISLANPLSRGVPAPAELAGYVNEWFYPALAARLAGGDLDSGLRDEVQAYRAAKVALQNELRVRIAALKDAEPAARERQLAEFAAQQAAPLAALESAAASLRTRLRAKDLMGEPFDRLEWMLLDGSTGMVPATPDAPPVLTSDAVMAAAYLQDGFSIEQRALLREAAIELGAEPGAGASSGSAPFVFFSPESARIPFSGAPSAESQQRWRDYVAAKNQLKAELLEALRGAPRHERSRTESFRRLAATQAPRIAALEDVAEEIRRAFERLPDRPGPPSPFALPSELATRISLYRQHKLEAVRALHALLVPDARYAGRSPPADGAKTERLVSADGAPLPARREAAVRQAIAEFDRKQGELIAALNEEKAAIRAALADYMRRTGGPRDRKSVDDLLRDFEHARQQLEIWEKFRDYQTAVLMPGLSPAQRRLLFDGAVESLSLPLPSGVVVP